MADGPKIRKMGRKNADRIKGMNAYWEMAICEPDLSEAKDRYERRYELKRRGYDFTKVCEIVAGIFQMDIRPFCQRGVNKTR